MVEFCSVCGEAVEKDAIALNYKLFGINADCCCLSCLARKLNVSLADLHSSILFYKKIGCPIFC